MHHRHTPVEHATRTITIVVTSPSNPGPATSLTNTAIVGATTPDPNPGNNLTTLTTGMIRRTDLSITKVATSSPGVAGQNLGYTLTVAKAGPSAEYGVVATDILPFGVGFAGASASQGSCGAAAGVVTCNLGTLDAGGVVTINVVIAIPSGFGGLSVTNNANVGPTGLDTNPADNATSVTTPVTHVADVSLTKSAAPNPVVAGGALTYALHRVERGSVRRHRRARERHLAARRHLRRRARLHLRWSQQRRVPDRRAGQWCDRGTGHHRDGRPGGARRFAAHEHRLRQRDLQRPEPGQQLRAGVHERGKRVADLQFTKTESVDPVVAGQQLTYTLTTHNNGPSNASGVVITDALPPLVTFASASPDCARSRGSRDVQRGRDSVGRHGIDDGHRGRSHGDAGRNRDRRNHADAVGNELDPNPADNGADARDNDCTRLADVWITKTAAPDPVAAGTDLTYHVTATNNGPSNAAAVTITDALPPGTSFVTASAGCTETAGTVQCDFGEVAFQATVDTTITVHLDPSMPDGSTITNTATVQSTDSDPQPANNSATATTGVNAVADLELAKTAAPNPAVGGQDVTYTLTVTNHGPSDALAVAVADTLPAGTTLVSAVPEQGSCTAAAGTVTCGLGTVTALDTVSVDVIVTVDAGALGQLDNTATVSSPTSDPSRTNNTATASVDVTAAADLSLTKALESTPLVPGTDAAYLLTVHNAGPSARDRGDRDRHPAAGAHLRVGDRRYVQRRGTDHL